MTDDSSRPRLVAAIEACFANADELLRAGGLLLDGGFPRLAYHVGVLAIEEVGKAAILKMQYVAEARGREIPPSIARAVDDHVRKLFWAIWGPSMGREVITREQVDEHSGLATGIHERRVRGLYVDADKSGLSVPMDTIPIEEAQSLLNFAGACAELERPVAGFDAITGDSESLERQEWFFAATDDPARRAQIMGSASMAKLRELGNVRAWTAWLKATFEKAESDAKAALDLELQRQPDHPASAKPKWRATIRLYSLSHSIRPKPLNEVNTGLVWTRFRTVSSRPHELLIDTDVTSSIAVDQVGLRLLAISRRIVMALNVASMGYFWFHEPLDRDPEASGKFYERLVDLDTNRILRIRREPPLRLDFGRERRVLDQATLNAWLKCFVAVLRYGPSEQDIVERYLDGLAMTYRIDVQMGFQVQAVAAFYLALKLAMKYHGAWSNDDEPFDVALKRFLTVSQTDVDQQQLGRLVEVGESINSGRGVPHAMQIDDVGVMKALCDIFFLRTYLGIDRPQEQRDDAQSEKKQWE